MPQQPKKKEEIVETTEEKSAETPLKPGYEVDENVGPASGGGFGATSE